MPQYDGRLELTWTNKHLALLAHEDGSYEWVKPSDYRVAEVRLLHDDVTIVGVAGKRRAADNLLISGDALHALTSLVKLPEFAGDYLGKVKLAYLDPPFNTQQSFMQYDDALEHSVWLTMMRDRLGQVKELLAPDGSIYVHCDTSEGAYLKIVMDEVFGRRNFRNEIIWKRQTAHSDSQRFGPIHEIIYYYAASDATTFNVGYTPYDQTYIDSHYSLIDADGRRYQLDNLTARGPRPGLQYTFRGVDPPPGRVWTMLPDKMEDLYQQGRVVFTSKGTPRRKRYLDEMPGLALQDIWTDINAVNSQAAEAADFTTQKPEALLHRIIAASSNPGDIVLDCFVGSGTTAAVAHKMGRRWIAVEREASTVNGFVIPRLTRVVENKDPGGVTKLTEWQGGGGFRVLDIAASMFEADNGLVFLAEWLTNGRLAEATAAQLGFEYSPEPPFAGRKGRSRLVVIDGVVNEAVVRLIATALPERERAVICGTGIDPSARPILRDVSPGSTLRKIPATLLHQYRVTRQLALFDPVQASPDSQQTDAAAKV